MSNALTGLRSAFAIGGPLFNLGLVVILGAISFVAVALPERDTDDELDLVGPAALAFVDESTTTSSSTTTTVPETTTTVGPLWSYDRQPDARTEWRSRFLVPFGSAGLNWRN